jgi:flagellar hook-associated protein 1 FlgK
LIISFTGPTSYEIINADTSAVLDTGTYDPAVGEDLFPSEGSALDFGYRARITGNPAAGDQFVIEYNSGGTGDNRNALRLAGLRDEQVMENGTASFQNSYAQFVAEIGTRSRQTDINLQAAQTLRQQAESAHQSVSGVNLDEEAANLIKFQQAYQASAQVISVTSGLFQSLLFALRG